MRKITSLLALLLCVSSLFATRYLIQPGTAGAAEWRAVGDNEVLINLSTYNNGSSATLQEALAKLVAQATDPADNLLKDGDEVWIIKGIYTGWTTGFVPSAAKVTYAGGFAGTETALNNRNVGEKSWDFTNETVWDGENYTKMFLNPTAYRASFIDGITFTRGGGTNGPIFNRVTMQNCKITDNKGAGNGAAVRFYGQGHIKNSYIANNINTHATEGSQLGGGIYINANAQNITIDGCVIEGNYANTGGGVHIQGSANSTISITNSFIQGNSGNVGSSINVSNATPVVVVANCVIANNGNAGAIAQMRNANMHYCTVVNNIGNRVEVDGGSTITNSVFFVNKTSGNSHTNITQTTGNFENCAYTGPEVFISATNIKLNTENEHETAGPWFVKPTSFIGLPETTEEWTELRTADWSLNASSKLIQHGDATQSPLFTKDITGKERSTTTSTIGAFEKDVVSGLSTSSINNSTVFTYGKTLNVISEGNATVTIFGINGQTITNRTINNNEAFELNSGIYIVKVNNKLGTSASKITVK